MRRTQLTAGDRVRVGRKTNYHSWTHEAVIVSTDRELSKAIQEQRLEARGITLTYRNRQSIDTTLIAVAVKNEKEGFWVDRFFPAREILFTQEEYEIEETRKAEATARYEQGVIEAKAETAPIAKALNEFLGDDEIFALMDNGSLGLKQEGVGMNSPGYVKSIPWEARPIVDALINGLGIKEEEG